MSDPTPTTSAVAVATSKVATDVPAAMRSALSGALWTVAVVLSFAFGMCMHAAVLCVIEYVRQGYTEKQWGRLPRPDSKWMGTYGAALGVLAYLTFMGSFFFGDAPYWLAVQCSVLGIWIAIACFMVLGFMAFYTVVTVLALVRSGGWKRAAVKGQQYESVQTEAEAHELNGGASAGRKGTETV